GSDQRTNVVGFWEEEEAKDIKVERALKELFRPEFLNRVDEIVHFHTLKEEELLKIIDLMLVDLKAGLAEKEISLQVTLAAKELILKKAYQKVYGARPLRRYIERHIEDGLAQNLIAGKLPSGSSATVDVEEDALVIRL
ncbi:MAG: ATP-dependent Clp protease ATP-binding subunit, partial [Clostridia bacterium]|nr:ATP-dependent Clp protease ATP-binding subunit [Clostridia bacterium]